MVRAPVKKGLDTTAKIISEKGGAPTHCNVLDLSEEGKIGVLIKQVGSEHPHLFAIINNAGIMHPERVLAGKMEHWRAMFEVNVLALLEACQTVG